MSTPTGLLPDAPAAPRRSNPFVGPRSIQPGEPLHGRRRETAELRDRLIADRIVLMYSPSGAGKTSLINAGLRPELEARGFRLLPTIRINHADDELAALDGYNRYRVSMMLSLEEGRDPAARIDPAALVSMSLADHLVDLVDRDDDRDHCLIVDQFEELLTLDPADLAAKHEFMQELGALLRDRRWWALFSMREDFVAPLDPYLDDVPTRLASHYRLELLGAEAATVAARQAAADGGVHFAPDAAAKLINDLRTVRVQHGDDVVETPGAFVEPVQLQVVCSQLWERLAPDARSIEQADVISIGNVDDALASYYEQRVSAAATEADVAEREIREWIEDALITEQGFRTQSLVWDHPGGPVALASLQNSHLVRTETHRGARWYELAHDRLVDPIRAANEAWRAEHLSILQARAGEWYQRDKPTGLLIGGRILREAEQWAAEHPDELNDVDREYLAKSRVMEESAQRLRRSSRRNLILAILAVIGLVVALILWTEARNQERRAEREETIAREQSQLAVERAQEAREAEFGAQISRSLAVRERSNAIEARDRATRLQLVAQARELAARSRAIQLENPALALAVAAESTGLIDPGATPDSAFAAIASARSGFSELSWQPGSGGIQQAGATGAAVSPDGTTFASAGCAAPDEACDQDPAATIYLRSIEDPDEIVATLAGHTDDVLDLAYGPTGVLASASADGTVRLWDTATGASEPFGVPAGDVVDSVAFHPLDPDVLATGDQGGNVVLWDLSGDLPAPAVLDRTGLPSFAAVNDVTFRFDGKLLAAATSSGDVVLWDATVGRPLRVLVAPLLPDDTGTTVLARGAATTLAFFPDPEPVPCPETENPYQPNCVDALVVGHDNGNLWRWESPNRQDGVDPSAILMTGHSGAIRDLAFDAADPTGTGVLATASDDRTIRLWEFSKVPAGNRDSGARQVVPVGTLAAHRSPVTAVAFAPDGGRLVSSSEDNTVRLWGAPEAADGGVRGLGAPTECAASPECVATDIAISADRLIASTDSDGVLRFFDAATGDAPAGLDPVSASAPLRTLAFHPTDDVLLVGGDAGVYRWDRTEAATLVPLVEDAPSPVHGVAFDESGRFAATADDRGMITVWDTGAWRPVATVDTTLAAPIGDSVEAGELRPVRSIAFTDGALLYGDSEGCIWSLPFDDGRLGGVDERSQIGVDQDGQILALDVSDDGFVAAGSRDQTVQVATIDRRGAPASLRGHEGVVGAIAFSDSYLASASDDGTIRLWWLDVRSRQSGDRVEHLPATGEVLTSSVGCVGNDGCRVLGVAFSDDGSILAAATSDGLIEIWDDLVDPQTACELARPFIDVDQLGDEIDGPPRVCFGPGAD